MMRKILTGYFGMVTGKGTYIESDPFHYEANAKAWLKRELKDAKKQDKTARGKVGTGPYHVDMDWGDKPDEMADFDADMNTDEAAER
jgi:hypothetical protein